jgi:hypothetical protein
MKTATNFSKALASRTVLLAFLPLFVYQTGAATRTWSGGSATGNLWSDTANWAGSLRPAATDDVYFGASPRAVSQNDLLAGVHSITFGVSGYEIIGNTLVPTNGITATNATGGSVLTDAIVLGANQSFTNLNGGSVLELLTVDLNGKGLILQGAGTNMLDVIADSHGGGSFTNNGTGTFLFFGTNSTFTGPMVLNSGTNLFIAHQERSPITWTAGTLGGTGTVGNVTASGISAKQLAPGYAGGTGILVTSNLVLNSSVTVVLNINGTNLPTFIQPGDYDRISTKGDITLGSPSLTLLFTNNFSPPYGTTFDLLGPLSPGNMVNGFFTNLPDGSLLTNNGVVYQLSYGFGHGVQITVYSTGVSRYWTGSGVNNLWSNPLNWQGNAVPQQGDTLIFEQTTMTGGLINSNDLPADMNFDSLHFQIRRDSGRTVTLLGNSFRLNSGIFLESEPSGSQNFNNGTYTISNSISLNNSQAITNGLYANFHLAGNVVLGPYTLSVGTGFFNSGNGGIFFDGSVSGSGVLEDNGGPGAIALNASNAVTGSIEVDGGTLLALHPQALGSASSGPVHVSSNAVLRLAQSAAVFSGSSLVLTGRLEVTNDNVTLAAALVGAGTNSLIIVSNSSFLASPSLTLTGGVTNTALLTYAGGFRGTLELPAGVFVRGGGALNIPRDDFSADGTVHNTVQLGGTAFATLTGAGQIDALISTTYARISPGSILDTNLAYSPLRVGTLQMGGSFATNAFSLLPNRPAGGATNTQIIVTNVPTLGNVTLSVFGQTNLSPNQQFTLIRNLSGAPIPDTFNDLPEGAFVTAHTNLALRISYLGGAGHDVVVTVQSNTPPVFLASVTNLTVNEHSTLVYTNQIMSFEPADTNLTWTLVPPFPAGILLNPTNGILTWTPDEGQAPSTNVVLCKVTDGFTPTMSATGTVIIAVNEINLPPVPNTNGLNTNVLAGHTLTMQLQATDPDLPPQPLTWTAISLPTNGAASLTPDGLLTYTPNPFLFGTNTVTVQVCDYDPSAVNSTSLCVTVSFKVQIIRTGIVTHTNDTTDVTNAFWPGSLREVITDLSTNSSGGHIEFNIPGTGPFKIAPLTPLPLLGANSFIDGYTQPGSHPNTKTNGTDAVIMIELSGEKLSGGTYGIRSIGSGLTIRGLCMNRFANGSYAIYLNANCGSSCGGDSGIAIEGCFIGTDIPGTAALPNTYGVEFGETSSSRIGGPDVSQRNLVSGNLLEAIEVDGDHANANVTMQNNLIGTDRTGTNALPNGGHGIFGLTTQGNAAGFVIEDNVICANVQGGISFGGTNQVFVRNKIGVGADGLKSMGNGGSGIFFHSGGGGHLIGGTNLSDANIIANNSGAGVDINSRTNVSVLGNSIFRNTGRAIIGSGSQAPVLTNTTTASSAVTVKGTFSGRGSTTYRLEFFYNADFSPSNAPQAWTFLGATNATTGPSGNGNFAVTFNQTLSGGFITATATDPNGNTSGISDGFALPTAAHVGITLVSGQPRVLWLTNFSGFILQSNANLLFSNGWHDVPGSPGTLGSNFFFDFPPTNAARFFRLRSP